MKTLSKILVGTVAAGAMAVSTATPAQARDRDGGIDAGEVIAGALVIGGIAAVAAAASDNDRDRWDYRDRRYDSRYDRDRYGYRYRGRGMDPRAAVDQCVRAVERRASRYSYGRAQVTRITRVRDRRRGFEVRGRLAVDERGYGRRGRRGYDTGKFSCDVEYGRIRDLDIDGIRGF